MSTIVNYVYFVIFNNYCILDNRDLLINQQ